MQPKSYGAQYESFTYEVCGGDRGNQIHKQGGGNSLRGAAHAFAGYKGARGKFGDKYFRAQRKGHDAYARRRNIRKLRKGDNRPDRRPRGNVSRWLARKKAFFHFRSARELHSRGVYAVFVAVG